MAHLHSTWLAQRAGEAGAEQLKQAWSALRCRLWHVRSWCMAAVPSCFFCALQLPDPPRVRPHGHMRCPPWQITVHVTATVMPRNKGTPGLKPAVHCVGFTAETDTEAASDWQGFD